MPRPRILIVDDDPGFSGRLADALMGLFAVEQCHSEAEYQSLFRPGRFDLLIMDMRLNKGHEGLNLLREALEADPLQTAIVMTAYADVETYTDALEAGALTYLDKKEFSPSLIARTVEAIIEQARMRRKVAELEERLRSSEPMELIGGSSVMRGIREAAIEAADLDAPVAIIGEPGTGKELVARNIHRLNPKRRDQAFAVFPRDCYQSADQFMASKSLGGVLFVKEAQRLDGRAWTSLLDRVKRASGGPKDIPQLIVAGTPGSPRVEKEFDGSLGTLRIEVSPLREHTEDIALIAQYALQSLHRQGNTHARSLRSTAIRLLEQMPWPGNVRELQLAIAYASSRADAERRTEIDPKDFPFAGSQLAQDEIRPLQMVNYKQHLARSELALVEAAIETFDETRQNELSEKLGYNDRYVFMRRIRKHFALYPGLCGEFYRTAELADNRSR